MFFLIQIFLALGLLALTLDGAAVPDIPSISGGARSSQIARCTDGEILISFSKRGFYNNETKSTEYLLNPVCAPFENPKCFQECKWASWCKSTGYQPTKTVVTGIGMRDYGPPYGNMLLLYCCEMTSTKIVDCEFKEESEMFGADVTLFAETNKRNQLNGPAVIRDVFSKKANGQLILRVEMCAVQRTKNDCITNAPIPRTGPFELITSPPEVVDSFFTNQESMIAEDQEVTRIREDSTVEQIFSFEPDAVDTVSNTEPQLRPPLAPPVASIIQPSLPALPSFQSRVASTPPLQPTRRPRPTRAPRPERVPWWQRTRRPRPQRPRWTPRPRPQRPRPGRPRLGNPHQQFTSGNPAPEPALRLPPPPAPPPPPLLPRRPLPIIPQSQPGPVPFRPRNVNPSQVFRQCCTRYPNVITPQCLTMCTYDNFSKQSLIQSYLRKTCPANAKDPLLGCASSFADHTRCCAGLGLATFRRGLCMPFCNPSRGLPELGIKFLPCLNYIEKISGCFKGHIARTQG